jgi:hypothetical protein
MLVEISKKQNRTVTQKQRIIDKQNDLQSKIDEFHKRVSASLGDFEWDDRHDLTIQVDEDEEGMAETDGESDNHAVDDLHIQQTKLWLPSTFGRNFCLKNGWGDIVDQEMELRIAQAEEALDQLRLGIGHKSLLYKIRIRKAKTQSSKTRSQAELAQINQRIKEHARRYRCARMALSSLGAKAKKLDKFKVLQDSDLKVNTDVAEESRLGQRNDTLAWFWRIEGTESSTTSWMHDSRCLTTTPKVSA